MKIHKKNKTIILAIIIILTTAIIVKAAINNKNNNTAPTAGVGIRQSSKRVNIIFNTDVTDPVKLQKIKDIFIQKDAEFKAQGKDLYVNGVKAKDLDLTKIGDSSSVVPMQKNIEN